MTQEEAVNSKGSKERIAALETQLADANRQLASSKRELDLLIYHLSHDLRAPLRGIDGYSQALLEDFSSRLDPMAKAYLEYIRDSSSRLSMLIDGLLQLSRIERAVLEIATVDLSEIAQIIFNELQSNEPSRKISFRCRKHQTVQADTGMMNTLLRCLLENAFKFSSECPEAWMEFGAMAIDGKQVFFVRDNGAGFSMDGSSQLFIPFQRMHSQSQYAGLGLGLAIAQRIVSRHNGRIWAESEPEKGATFYFSIQSY